jgi:hypothetical protein
MSLFERRTSCWKEEQHMAKWVADHLRGIAVTYPERLSAGAQADR